MSASTKLATAVQALCHLARTECSPQNSDTISRAIGINASRLRNLLSMLTRSNIIVSVRGLNGGFALAKSPESIHLQEIYCAVETRKAFHLDVTRSEGECTGSSANVSGYFLHLFSDIQIEIEEKMRMISLRDILVSIEHQTQTLPSSERG